MAVTRVIREIIAARDLLLTLIDKELRIRYKQSILGPFWSFLRPILLMCLFIMLQIITGIQTDGVPYPILVYTALLPWTFLSSALTIATESIVNNAPIIKKIYCPRIIFPLVAIGACLIDLFIAALPLIIMLIYYRIGISTNICYLPLLILIQLILLAGISLVTSSVAVYRRDIIIVMPFMLQFWMFASPVMYPLKSVPEKWKIIYNLNPMVGIIESYRNVLLYNRPPFFPLLLVDVLISFALLFLGIIIFMKIERKFADVI